MWTGFLSKISYRQKVTLSVLCGVIVGLTGLFFYLLRMHTYIIREFGIRKGLKKLVISSKIRIFIGENQ